MKIVTYNIQFGRGRDGKVDLGRIIDAVRGADVIALQEVDRFWARSHMMDQVEVLVDPVPFDRLHAEAKTCSRVIFSCWFRRVLVLPQ